MSRTVMVRFSSTQSRKAFANHRIDWPILDSLVMVLVIAKSLQNHCKITAFCDWEYFYSMESCKLLNTKYVWNVRVGMQTTSMYGKIGIEADCNSTWAPFGTDPWITSYNRIKGPLVTGSETSDVYWISLNYMNTGSSGQLFYFRKGGTLPGWDISNSLSGGHVTSNPPWRVISPPTWADVMARKSLGLANFTPWMKRRAIIIAAGSISFASVCEVTCSRDLLIMGVVIFAWYLIFLYQK